MNPTSDLSTYLFTQGVLGVVCLALAIACLKLYNRNQALQDARLQDAKDVTKDVTPVIQANTASISVLTAKIESSKSGGTS